MKNDELPSGFSLALAREPVAMKNFSALPQSMQMDILQKARGARGKGEMQALVQGLAEQK